MKNAVLVLLLVLFMTSCEYGDPAGSGYLDYHLSSNDLSFLN